MKQPKLTGLSRRRPLTIGHISAGAAIRAGRPMLTKVATERGQLDDRRNRYESNKLVWKDASPRWNFDDATFDRTATDLNKPDHVDIVIYNYGWRLSRATGEPEYDKLERKLFEGPVQ
jgi:hypothetical protein